VFFNQCIHGEKIMSLTIEDVFGSGATVNDGGDGNIVIPINNLAVISGVSADYSNGAEVVFAILDHFVTGTDVPLASGNIEGAVSTSLLEGGTQLRKSYSFNMTLGDIELSSLDVVEA
jgi:hypothetical protein